MTAEPIWGPSGEQDLLELVATGPLAPDTGEREWRFFTSVLRDVAASDGGRVDPNRVRPLVTGAVAPRRISAFYSRAAARDLIVADGWTVSEDTGGRNSGKPARCYRWVGGAL